MLHLESNIQNWRFGYRAHAYPSHPHPSLSQTIPTNNNTMCPSSSFLCPLGTCESGRWCCQYLYSLTGTALFIHSWELLVMQPLEAIVRNLLNRWHPKTCDRGSHTEVCIMSVLVLPGSWPHWSMYNECLGPSKLQSEPQASKMVDL